MCCWILRGICDAGVLVRFVNWLLSRTCAKSDRLRAYLASEVITGGARSPEQCRTYLALLNEVESLGLYDR